MFFISFTDNPSEIFDMISRAQLAKRAAHSYRRELRITPIRAKSTPGQPNPAQGFVWPHFSLNKAVSIMRGNTFGNLLTLTTFGESHGPALGAVIDGCPAGIALDVEDFSTQ